MGRPSKKMKDKPTNLTLNPVLKEQAKLFAYEKNESLSEMGLRDR